jgi:hypothetical protein
VFGFRRKLRGYQKRAPLNVVKEFFFIVGEVRWDADKHFV